MDRRHPQGKNIATQTGLPRQLFTGGISLGPHPHRQTRQLAINYLGPNFLNCSKVNQTEPAIVPAPNQIVRFKIPMNHTIVVNKLENVQSFLQQRHHLGLTQPSGPTNLIPQGLPINQLLNQIKLPFFFKRIQQLGNTAVGTQTL